MLKTVNKNVDGKEFSITQFPAMFGMRIKIKLLKVLGPSFGSLIMAAQRKGQVDPALIQSAVTALVGNLATDSTPELILELLSSTRLNGKEIDENIFNMEFAGAYITMYKLLAAVVEVNNFFDLSSIGNRLKKALAQTKTEEEFSSN